MVKDRLAARKQQRNLFAPVRSGILGNEGLTSLNVELAWLGSIPRIVLRLATRLFYREIKDIEKLKTYREIKGTENRTETEQNRKDIDGERHR